MPSTTVWVSFTTPSPAADSNQHPRQLANQKPYPRVLLAEIDSEPPSRQLSRESNPGAP